MKLVRESLYNFERGKEIKNALKIGNIALIKQFFSDSGIGENQYYFKDDKIIFHYSLDLSKNKNFYYLPDNLEIKDNLDLSETNIKELPKNLKIGGSLFLDSCKNIENLPEKLHIPINLFISNSGIKVLPSELFVGNSLWLSPEIEKIPPSIIVQNYIIFKTSEEINKEYLLKRIKGLNKFSDKIAVF